jgi:hypothetical protein
MVFEVTTILQVYLEQLNTTPMPEYCNLPISIFPIHRYNVGTRGTAYWRQLFGDARRSVLSYTVNFIVQLF